MKVIHEGGSPFLPSAMRCSGKTDGAGEGTGMLIHFTLGLSRFAGQRIHSGLASSTRKPEKGRAKKRNSLGQNFNCQAERLGRMHAFVWVGFYFLWVRWVIIAPKVFPKNVRRVYRSN